MRATTGRGSLDLADRYLSEKHDLFNDPRVGPSAFYVQLEKLRLMDLGVRHRFGGHMFYLFLIGCGVRSSFEERADVVWPALLKAYGELGTPAGERLSEVLFTRMLRAAAVHEPRRGIPSSSARPL